MTEPVMSWCDWGAAMTVADVADVAARIAAHANECCHRSDGWEEALATYVRDLLGPMTVVGMTGRLRGGVDNEPPGRDRSDPHWAASVRAAAEAREQVGMSAADLARCDEIVQEYGLPPIVEALIAEVRRHRASRRARLKCLADLEKLPGASMTAAMAELTAEVAGLRRRLERPEDAVS